MSPRESGGPTPEEMGISQEEMGLIPTPEQQEEAREREERFGAFQKKLESAKRRNSFVEAADLLVGNLKNRAFNKEQRSSVNEAIDNLQEECEKVGMLESKEQIWRAQAKEVFAREQPKMSEGEFVIKFVEDMWSKYEGTKKAAGGAEGLHNLVKNAREARNILQKVTEGFTKAEAAHFEGRKAA